MENPQVASDKLEEAVTMHEPFVENTCFLNQPDVLHRLSFPADINWNKTLVISVDSSNGPYCIRDFLTGISEVIKAKDIAYFGSTCISCAFMLGLKTKNVASALVKKKEILVKGKKALISPIERITNILVDWLPPDLPNETVLQHFIDYGQIIKCEIMKHSEPGFKHILSNRRQIQISLRHDIKLSDLPYFIIVKGMTGSVTVAERQPLCYKCKDIGEVRNDCEFCCHFGYESSQDKDCMLYQRLTNRSRIDFMPSERENVQKLESQGVNCCSNSEVTVMKEIEVSSQENPEKNITTLIQPVVIPQISSNKTLSDEVDWLELLSQECLNIRKENDLKLIPNTTDETPSRSRDKMESTKLSSVHDLFTIEKDSPASKENGHMRIDRENITNILQDVLGMMKTATRQLMSHFTDHESIDDYY